MKITKFEGATMREALSKVKAELGDQAVVVSTRQIRRGLLGTAYEIAAAIDDDDLDDGPRPRHGGGPVGPTTPAPVPAALRQSALGGASAAPTSSLSEADVERLVAPVRAELRTLRALVRAAGDQRMPGELRTELAALRRSIEELSARDSSGGGPGVPPPPLAELARDARLTASSDGAVVMLVGPTGVGKTTAIAKIAARAALVEDRRVAIVTLDSYRVGGVDQIRTFADLIGVPLSVVDDPRTLAATLEGLADYDLVLIDTAGRSPLDQPALDELERAVRPLRHVEVHLAIAAGTAPAMVDELHRRYAGLGLRRLLWTKIDEVSAAPELIRAGHRLELPVTWVTTGQAVPEDIEEVSPTRLLELAERGLAPRPAPAPGPAPRSSALRIAA